MTKDYTKLSAGERQGYINRYSGKAKYNMYETEEKITLKRTTKNILYYTTKYLGLGTIAGLGMDWIIWDFTGSLLLRLFFLIVWYHYLVFGRVIHFFRLKIEILKNQRYIIVTREWKRPAKVPLEGSNITVQNIGKKDLGRTSHYGVVYNSDILFFMLDDQPEFKRVIEYLKNIGYTLIDERWEYKEASR